MKHAIAFKAICLTVLCNVLLLVHSVSARNQQLQFHPVLKLEKTSNEQILYKVEFLSTQLVTNTRSVDDTHLLMINGARVDVPRTVMDQINNLRHEVGSDLRTGGIETPQRGFMCMMDGPAIGSILYSNYVKYSGSAYTVTPLGMKPVASTNGNCLFATHYRANKEAARTNAAKIIAIMETLKNIYAP